MNFAVRLPPPDNGVALDLLSWPLAYEVPPKPEESQKTSRQAIRLIPSIGFFHYHLGRALMLLGRFDEARKEVRKGRVYIAHSRQKAILGYPL
jgi:hypothetical protein